MNNIDKLVVGGESFTRPEDIMKEILDYNEKLYTETETWKLQFDMRACPMVTEEENQMFNESF